MAATTELAGDASVAFSTYGRTGEVMAGEAVV